MNEVIDVSADLEGWFTDRERRREERRRGEKKGEEERRGEGRTMRRNEGEGDERRGGEKHRIEGRGEDQRIFSFTVSLIWGF